MDATEKIRAMRRAGLAAIIEECRQADIAAGNSPKSGAAAASRMLEIPEAQLYQWTTDDGDSKRNMSSATARRIERAAKKPPFWLDQEHGAQERTSEPSLPDQIQSINVALNALIPVLAASKRGRAGEIRNLIRGGTPARLLAQDPLAKLLDVLAEVERGTSDKARRA